MKKSESIGCILRPIAECSCQAVLTDAMQVADILEWVLKQTGPAKIYQTTFSVSEEFLRRFYFIRNKGLVISANLIIDHKATNKTLKLWNFISNVFDNAYMTDNHSKILLVEALSGIKVSVVTSQNLTRGNRLESTIISTEHSIFESLKQKFSDAAELKSIKLDELLTRRTETD